MENTVEEVKSKLDIVTYLSEFMVLKKAGRNFKGNCPFHHEKTPSFVVSPDRQIWHCFGACQDGGDVIKFLMKIENITFSEALKELAQKVGVTIKNVTIEDKAWKNKEKLYAINQLAADFYHFLLTKHKAGKYALDYIKNRDISDKIIDSFLIGYSPDSWDSLFKFLTKKGFKPEDILKTGLVLASSKGGFYDRFRKRLMFPLKDHRGNIVGFSGRILDSKNENEKDAKYVNTPETEIYHKREILFGLDITKDMIRKENAVLVVEGEFDMLSLFRNGISNVVAVKGSAVTKEQLHLLKRYANKLFFALDSDNSGQETIKRTIKEAEALDFEMYVVRPDFAKDPDEAIKKDLVAYKKLIEKPIPVYDFLLEKAAEQHTGNDAFSKKNIANDIIPFIANISNPIVKDFYTKKISELLDVEQSAVEELIRKKTAMTSIPYIKNPEKLKVETNRLELLQTYILSMLFQDTNPIVFSKKITSIIDPSDFTIPAYQKILEQFLLYQDNIDKEGNFALASFVSVLPKELLPMFDQLLLFDLNMIEIVEDKNLIKMVYEFKRLSLKKRIKEMISKKDNNDNEELPKLTKILSDIEKKLLVV
jgi:DNA primase